MDICLGRFWLDSHLFCWAGDCFLNQTAICQGRSWSDGHLFDSLFSTQVCVCVCVRELWLGRQLPQHVFDWTGICLGFIDWFKVMKTTVCCQVKVSEHLEFVLLQTTTMLVSDKTKKKEWNDNKQILNKHYTLDLKFNWRQLIIKKNFFNCLLTSHWL